MKKLLLAGACASLIGLFPTSSNAQEDCDCDQSYSLRADSHGPIGVMGDHTHKQGEWMLSYRFMQMHMDGNQMGTNNVSAEEIATTVPNRFFGIAGQPPTLRVVPTEMTTDMHMVGAMYALNDTVTFMAMGSYIDREMDHLTFAGGAGSTILGGFTTRSKGFGDTRTSALVNLYQDDVHRLHVNAGLSLPTGSITEEDTVLAPTGATPRLRLPYAMQLGSGTFDLMPGLTYSGHHNKWGWGAQYMGAIRLGENSEDYTLGDKHMLTAWGSYLIAPSVSASFRLNAETESQIDGIDSQIVAPVQTADPDNYGGERISTALGINTVIPRGVLKGHRFSAEVVLPVYQDLNGPQLERDYAFTLGWSKAF